MSNAARTMPGFTAERALAAASRGYSTGVRTGGSGAAQVVPQALVLDLGRGSGCNPSCVCITAEGCPCCESILAPITRFKNTVTI